MRSLPALLAALALTALAVLPGMALAQDGHGDHGGHGDAGPADPMIKNVVLYLDAAGGLSDAPAEAGAVAAAPTMPDGSTATVAWSIAATKNIVLDSAVFVELFGRVDNAAATLNGPEGAAFVVQLVHNGAPVEGSESFQKLDSGILLPGDTFTLTVFLPRVELAIAAGDTLGIQVGFFGVNTEALPAISYLVGGEDGSRMAFRIRMASLAELDLPKEVGPWPVTPLSAFDPQAAAKGKPGAKVVTLKAFQFGFRGAPIVVDNGTRVILHLTVDESLSTSGEGHAGHAHEGGGEGGEAGHAMAWDHTMVTALHGFSLASLDPRLQTVLFDGLVVTMEFVADKPGNHTFLCTVFCGTGHGKMLDRLQIVGEEPPEDLTPSQADGGEDGGDGTNPVPGPGALLLAGAALGAALLARRAGKRGA